MGIPSASEGAIAAPQGTNIAGFYALSTFALGEELIGPRALSNSAYWPIKKLPLSPRRPLLNVMYNSAMMMTLAIVVTAGANFACTPIRVWDGDGPIWCNEGPRIRLAGIAARELDGACKTSHPCPPASGESARDGLVAMLGGQRGTSSSGHIILRVRS